MAYPSDAYLDRKFKQPTTRKPAAFNTMAASTMLKSNGNDLGAISPNSMSLSSITAFNNAGVVHQKRLKVNCSQIAKCQNDFNIAKFQFSQMLTDKFSSTNRVDRIKTLNKLDGLVTRYEALYENRFEMLRKQDAWLEEALEVEHIMYTDELEQALDMQIAATQDLVQRKEEVMMRRELDMLKQANTL